MEESMLVHDVIISGQGFNVVYTIGTLATASKLVATLYLLKKKRCATPYPLSDDDNHLVGFVIPSRICSAVVSTRESGDNGAARLIKCQEEALKAQADYFRSHTQKRDF